MRLRRITALLVAALLATGARGLCAEDSSAKTEAAKTDTAKASASKEATAWVIGIARFTAAEDAGSGSILRDTLPRLMVENLKSLPTRRVPEADAAEIAAAKALRERFAAGGELAAKLDARAGSFFSYTNDDVAWRNGLANATKDAVTASKKLDELVKKGEQEDRKPPKPPLKLAVELWSDHAAGKLVDAPTGSFGQAAKTAGVDLLVTGRLSFTGGYAALSLRGFDAALSRTVFAWKGYCAVDDPEPLAAEMAQKLEDWSAGRPMARAYLKVEPASAEIRVNGVLLQGTSRVVYAYEPGPIAVSAKAEGYTPLSFDLDLAIGERITREIKLEAVAAGSASVSATPPDAQLSLDSTPIGSGPLSIDLDGKRSFLEGSAKDFESKTIVLPASGYADIKIDLRPADGLGPKGRIEAAKDRFYSAFGLFASSIPLTALSTGVYNQYLAAYERSYDDNIYNEGVISANVLDGCIVLCCVTAAYAIFRLVQYLGAAN